MDKSPDPQNNNCGTRPLFIGRAWTGSLFLSTGSFSRSIYHIHVLLITLCKLLVTWFLSTSVCVHGCHLAFFSFFESQITRSDSVDIICVVGVAYTMQSRWNSILLLRKLGMQMPDARPTMRVKIPRPMTYFGVPISCRFETRAYIWGGFVVWKTAAIIWQSY